MYLKNTLDASLPMQVSSRSQAAEARTKGLMRAYFSPLVTEAWLARGKVTGFYISFPSFH